MKGIECSPKKHINHEHVASKSESWPVIKHRAYGKWITWVLAWILNIRFHTGDPCSFIELGSLKKNDCMPPLYPGKNVIKSLIINARKNWMIPSNSLINQWTNKQTLGAQVNYQYAESISFCNFFLVIISSLLLFWTLDKIMYCHIYMIYCHNMDLYSKVLVAQSCPTFLQPHGLLWWLWG